MTQSTFAHALERFFPEFRRCNQDDLGNRRKVEALALDSLRQGLSVCIDRTNIDERYIDHRHRSRYYVSIYCPTVSEGISSRLLEVSPTQPLGLLSVCPFPNLLLSSSLSTFTS